MSSTADIPSNRVAVSPDPVHRPARPRAPRALPRHLRRRRDPGAGRVDRRGPPRPADRGGRPGGVLGDADPGRAADPRQRVGGDERRHPDPPPPLHDRPRARPLDLPRERQRRTRRRPTAARRMSRRTPTAPSSARRTSSAPSCSCRSRGGTSSQRPGTATTGARRDMRGATASARPRCSSGHSSAARSRRRGPRPDADRRALAASRALRGRGCCLRGCRPRARRYRDGRRRWRPRRPRL